MVRLLAHVRAPSRGVYLAEQVWRPRPCVTRTGGPGRPGFPSALTMKGCLRWLDAVRMKGRRKPPGSARGVSSRVRTRKTVPGWKTPQWSAARRRARKARGRLLRGARLRSSAIPALRSLTHVREKGKEGATPRLTNKGGDDSRLYETRPTLAPSGAIH